MTTDRRTYWIWLQRRLPLGSPAINRLFEHFEDVEDVYAADKKQLLESGISRKDAQALSDKSLTEANRILRDMRELDGWVMTPDDARYPDNLRHIAGFPAVLYVQGVFPDLNAFPSLGVVSTREISVDGAKTTFCLSAGLAAAGVIIVSGGAKGGDAAAHDGALYAKGKTVLVKAAAPEVEYPRETTSLRADILKNGGAIVTEYPPACLDKCDYHVRNRLISGMSVGVCVTEAPARSGTHITANFAREQGRSVYAVPGNTTDGRHDGTHRQIRQGATLVTRSTEILEDLAMQYPGLLDVKAAEEVENTCLRAAFPSAESPAPETSKPKAKTVTKKTTELIPKECPAEASEAAARVFALMDVTACAVDTLAKKAGLSPQQLLILLTELEMFGCIEQTAGLQYRIKQQQKGDR